MTIVKTFALVAAFAAVLPVGSMARAGDATPASLWQSWTPGQKSQHWVAGWDKLTEPLNKKKSGIKWTVKGGALTVTYTLVSAKPNKLYQVGVHFFCDQGAVPQGKFGQFPVGPCNSYTAQGVTASITAAELGVVLTDADGMGEIKAVVKGIQPGTYAVEFDARDGAGCNVEGGSGQQNCGVDFQSPGPYGTVTQIVIP